MILAVYEHNSGRIIMESNTQESNTQVDCMHLYIQCKINEFESSLVEIEGVSS